MRPFSLLCLVAVASLGARSVRLLYVEAPEDAPAALHLVVGKDVTRLDLPRLAISSGTAQLPSGATRIHLAERAPTRREPLPVDAPHVDIPAGDRDVLLVLMPGGRPGPLGFKAQAIDFSPARLPEGSVLWMNLSRCTLEARLGSSQARVAPGQSRVLVPQVSGGSTYPVFVDLAPAAGEAEPQPLLRATWMRDPGRRQLLFVLDDPDRAVPRIVSVPHRIPPPAAESSER
jgi:hypothetical protein